MRYKDRSSFWGRFLSQFCAMAFLSAICCGLVGPVFAGQDLVGSPPLCPAVRSFMDKVFKVATLEPDRKARLVAYEAAIHEVMVTAKRHFGPFWDPRGLKRLVTEYVQHQELYRRPPEGWDPRGSRDNILLFSDIARDGLRIDLSLLRWCEDYDR